MSAYNHNPFDAPIDQAHPLELPRLRGAVDCTPHSRPDGASALAGGETRNPDCPPGVMAPRAQAGDAAASAALPPLPSVSLLPGLEAGGSLASVLACRLEQIERWGHTPEKDRERPLQSFLVDLESYAHAAREDLQYREGHDRVRKRLVKLAALTLAAIDRVDMEPQDDG